MAKFSIEYVRTVRLAPYETLKIGHLEEFDSANFTYGEAFTLVESRVSGMIEVERERLVPMEED